MTPDQTLSATLLTALTLVLGGLFAASGARAGGEPPGSNPLSGVRSWVYQLQGVSPAVLARSAYDMAVIDYSRDGSEKGALLPSELAMLKVKPDGGRRIVLAYLSIGEAEDYRYYWDAEWSRTMPGWVGPENPEWKGNYRVRFWEGDWQDIIYRGAGSYLDKIVAAGFDGVYLDRIDAFEEEDPDLGPSLRMLAMVQFVTALAERARSLNPGFLIVVQNGEELLENADYRQTIDGFAKEDLLFGLERDGMRNAHSDTRASLNLIALLLDSGKPVFLAEYLSDAAAIEMARTDAATLGAPLFVGGRALDEPYSR